MFDRGKPLFAEFYTDTSLLRLSQISNTHGRSGSQSSLFKLVTNRSTKQGHTQRTEWMAILPRPQRRRTDHPSRAIINVEELQGGDQVNSKTNEQKSPV